MTIVNLLDKINRLFVYVMFAIFGCYLGLWLQAKVIKDNQKVIIQKLEQCNSKDHGVK